MKAIKINDRDLITLWMFNTRVGRLNNIVKGQRKGSSISCKLRITSPSELKTTGISTGIRLSGSLNELKSFMFKDERTYFPTIQNLVSLWYRNDKQIQVHLDINKAFWRAYGINEMNAARYDEELAKIKEMMGKHETVDEQYYITVGYLLDLVEHAGNLYKVAKPEEKRQIVSTVFSNLKWDGKNLKLPIKNRSTRF